jgi:hypothetical protein
MSLLSRLEPKLRRFAVLNLTVILIAGQVLAYVAYNVEGQRGGGLDVIEQMELVPAKVVQGEVWRLLTFLFIPPFTNLIVAFIYWYAFYFCGTFLEQVWGAFRYNAYLLVGYLATVGVAFLEPNFPTSNFFLKTTVFLAFATLNPDFSFYIYFLVPVKAKWLAALTWLFLAYSFARGNSIERAFVVASVGNYLLFFGGAVWRKLKQRRRRKQFQKRTQYATQRLVHKCAVCGLTSEDAPQTQFRYCSRCDGERCYCPEHLRDHEHILRHAEAVGERAS